MKKGLVYGKFMPFHKGHEFLIRTALPQCEQLTVLVFSNARDRIPGWQRYSWVKNTFPELDVRHVSIMNSRDLEDPQTILRNTPSGLDALFSSDKSDSAQLADRLGITHVIIDPYRKEVPVTSADIRIDPMAHWEHIPQEVRPFFIRRVALVGPESCGKSFLSEQLAVHFQTVFVEEYGRTYCERFGMDLSELDFAQIAGGQLYREDEMARQANRILFCDTDLIVTQVWSEVYFKGRCQPWIIGADHGRQYDLYLLLAPDIPWINDGLREYEGRREWMFERLRVEMESRNLPYKIIRGDFESRTRLAIESVQTLLNP